VIYADFEALVRKIYRGEHAEIQKVSYTEKTEWHKACGFSCLVIRNDGEVVESKVYRCDITIGNFLNNILQEEVAIREILVTLKCL